MKIEFAFHVFQQTEMESLFCSIWILGKRKTANMKKIENCL
jgi:hypothetical protein